MNTTTEEIINSLRAEFESREEIIIAYLFGSYAKGTNHSKSDIDVGLVVNEDIKDSLWYTIELKNELELKYEFASLLDIRILNDRSPKFRFNAIYKQPRIFVRDEKKRVEFETETLLVWYDIRHTWEEFYKTQMEVMKK